MEAEGQISVPGGLQRTKTFSPWKILDTNKGKASRTLMHSETGLSSLRLNFAVEEAELCCQSFVSPIQLLLLLWGDHWDQVRLGYREMRKGKTPRMGINPRKHPWQKIKLSPELWKHSGTQHLASSCCCRRSNNPCVHPGRDLPAGTGTWAAPGGAGTFQEEIKPTQGGAEGSRGALEQEQRVSSRLRSSSSGSGPAPISSTPSISRGTLCLPQALK